MSQGDIIDFLKLNPNKWFSNAEISKGIKINECSVARCLKILRSHHDIYFEEISNNIKRNRQYIYKYRE